MGAYDQIMRIVDRRMDAAAILLVNALKEELSVPVPRYVISRGQGFIKQGPIYTPSPNVPKGWIIYKTSTGRSVYVKPADKGAIPRKFEGRLRAGQTWERITAQGNIVRRVGTNVLYARRLEEGGHPFFMKTVDKVKPQLERLMGQPI